MEKQIQGRVPRVLSIHKCPKQNNFQLLIIHIVYIRYQAGGDFEILAHDTTICTNS